MLRLRNFKGGGQDTIWTVEPLDGWMDGRMDDILFDILIINK
jgi:hypothetical protein